GGFNVAKHAASDPVLISYLVGVACEAITLAGMENILSMAGPDAEAAETVRTTLAAHRSPLSLRRALIGEYGIFLASMNVSRRGGPEAAVRMSLEGEALSGEARSQSSSATRGALKPSQQRVWLKLLDAAEAR